MNHGRIVDFPARMIAVVVMGFFVAQPVLADPILIQGAEAGAREMRQFWHVFIAYAIAWVLIFGWLISILKRLRRVEERLEP